MALTRNDLQVGWSGTNATSISLASTTLTWSDPITFHDTDVSGGIIVEIDNAGAPSSTQTCEIWIAYQTGTITGASGDYATDKHSVYCGVVETWTTGGENPARKAIPVDVANFKGCKVGLKNVLNTATMTGRVHMQTQRAA